MTAHDVLVVGGGPAGAACAYWLAEAGHDVLLLEKKHYPREKTCGDGLTPRSVKQLHDIGLAAELSEFHRFDGLRSLAFGRTLEMKWPAHPDYPSFGYVITRKDLDHLVAERAVKAGAVLWQEAEAIAPLLDGGLLRGATVKRKDTGTTEEVRARYVVVADGANSRFGRALGTSRERAYPLGMAIRGYFESPRHDEPWIESHLDIRDKAGNVLPGYGWIFPVGDGRVNVGIGLLSTFHQWKAVNTSQLMESFVDYAPKSWGISPETSCGAPTGGKLPMALSVTPHAGPTYLVVGDAGGSVNPFNGEGIAYAYETGRMAAETLDVALRTGDGHALQDYDRRIHDEYALYFKVARAFVKIIGRPELMRALVSTGMRSRTLMEWVLRIMSNMLRLDELGPAEAIYKSVAAIARVA
ncbi:MAG TPA: geranylgeranyl reductase family protein [Acidimicrobiales bacterium]|nr:geranylgeranyl reductase family protein [Acidimicrobiales bacterium]